MDPQMPRGLVNKEHLGGPRPRPTEPVPAPHSIQTLRYANINQKLDTGLLMPEERKTSSLDPETSGLGYGLRFCVEAFTQISTGILGCVHQTCSRG